MDCGCNNGKANKSIECSVKECKYHCDSQNYCSLDKINVMTHETNPTMCECVDCGSFECK